MSSLDYLKNLSASPRPLGDLSGRRDVRFGLYSEAILSTPLIDAVGDCFGETFESIRRSMSQSGKQV